MLRLLPLLVVILAAQLVDAVPRVRAASSTFTVTTTADPPNDPTTTCSPGPIGPCTLRQAINSANANGNPAEQDIIEFDIPGTGAQVINLTSTLPPITQPVLLDGTSQPGASCSPRNILIEIRGTYTPGQAGLNVNHVTAAAAYGTTIQGIAVRYTATGILLGTGTNHHVRCSNIGLNAAGSVVGFYGNSAHGIHVHGTSNGAIIGGTTAADRNIISGNGQYGLVVSGSGTQVQGNYIGVGPDGVTPAAGDTGGVIGNASGGVLVVERDFMEPSLNVVIGSTDFGGRNVISGNQGSQANGINVAGSNNLSIVGNFIGIGADGTTAVGNTRAGIFADANYEDVPIEQMLIQSNVISANGTAGLILNPGVDEATVVLNIIGLDATASVARGNVSQGITIFSLNNKRTDGTTIGLPGLGNVISGNGGNGIQVTGWAENTKIAANTIGYASDGITLIPNGAHGVHFFSTQPQTGGYVGGTDAATENRIYAEATGAPAGNGILLQETQAGTPARIEIRRNSIRSEGHAIDLVAYNNGSPLLNTVDPNDDGDADDGPNGLQNYPDQLSAQPGNPGAVSFRLQTAPGQYTVRFYASATCESDTARQAHRYLTSTSFTVSGSGSYTASDLSLGAAVAGGEYITATATKTDGGDSGNTSELSDCAQAGVTQPGISSIDPERIVAGTHTFELTVMGNGFPGDAKITWNGTPLTTIRFDETHLAATIPASILGYTAGMAAISVTGSGGFETEAVEFEIMGSSSDVDCSMTANAEDALYMLKILSGLAESHNGCTADPDHDGEVTIADVLWIRREVAGLEPNPLEMIT